MKLLRSSVLRSRSCQIGALVVILVGIVALLAPVIAPYSPTAMNIPELLRAPSASHPFGTDEYGRDVLSRVIYGARISMRIGLFVTALTAMFGVPIGLIAGFFARADNLIMRVTDAFLALPSILLALAIVAVFGPAETTTVLALAVTYTPRTARVIRGAVLSIKGESYVEAARAIGCGTRRILLRHVLVNCVGIAIVQQSFIFAYAVLAEAELGFLGAGAPPPAPSWGNIISEARSAMKMAPWIMLFPGLLISTTVLGINMLGDGLRNALDPKSQRDRS